MVTARSGHCQRCGMRIRPKAKDMSLGAAVRKHYWRHHPEVYLEGKAKARWNAAKRKAKAKAKAKRAR